MINGEVELQGKKGRKRTRAGVLAVTLGLTATLAASPTVKRENAVVPGNSHVRQDYRETSLVPNW